jgi:phosphoglycolate phosphatase
MAASEAIDGMIFDLDGTLADTIGDLGGSVNAALASRNLPTFRIEDFKMMVGDGFATLMRRALPAELAFDQDSFDAIVAEARSRYESDCLKTTKPFPGIQELLTGLVSRGIVLAVLSNKPQALSLSMVEALFPGLPFVAILGERPGVPRKPDPQAALGIARATGIPPGSWAFVGDSGVDMKTAGGAGMRAWGASWGYRSPEELRAGGAETIFDFPSDILVFLGKNPV